MKIKDGLLSKIAEVCYDTYDSYIALASGKGGVYTNFEIISSDENGCEFCPAVDDEVASAFMAREIKAGKDSFIPIICPSINVCDISIDPWDEEFARFLVSDRQSMYECHGDFGDIYKLKKFLIYNQEYEHLTLLKIKNIKGKLCFVKLVERVTVIK